MKNLILFYLAVIFLSGCKPVKTQENVSEKDFAFHVGYDASPMFCGALRMPADTNQYMYFTDVQTNKCIKVFMLGKPEPVLTISLKQAIDTLESIQSLSVRHMDTIILLSSYTNKIAVIDRSGRCYRYFDLNKNVNLPNGDVYELSGTYLNSETSANSITLRAEWRSNRFDDVSGKTPETDLEYMLYWFERNYHAAYVANVSGISADSVKVRFGLYDFHKQAGGSDCVYDDPPDIVRTNNRLFIFSRYTNAVIELDRSTLEIVKQTPINSKFARLDAKPLKIEPKSLGKFQDYTDDVDNMEALVTGFNYDHYKHVYYLTLCHKLPKGVEEEQGYKKRPFSVLVLDDGLKLIKEIPFTDGRYFAATILTKYGLLFYKINEDPKNENITYTLLHLD